MRRLYNELFYIPKHGKIREKVMLTRVATTVAVILSCLVAMSLSAYAYFSCSITSAVNTIKAANFEANVSIVKTGTDEKPVDLTKNGHTQTAVLEAGEYTVTLTEGTSTAQTGFCIITLDGTDYYTHQIGVDINANNEKRELVAFVLKVNEPNTAVTIESHWGTSSYYDFYTDEGNDLYIIKSDPLKVIEIGTSVNGTNEKNDEKETTVDETTEQTQSTDQ